MPCSVRSLPNRRSDLPLAVCDGWLDRRQCFRFHRCIGGGAGRDRAVDIAVGRRVAPASVGDVEFPPRRIRTFAWQYVLPVGIRFGGGGQDWLVAIFARLLGDRSVAVRRRTDIDAGSKRRRLAGRISGYFRHYGDGADLGPEERDELHS